MSEQIIIALAQLNFTVGDISGNFSKSKSAYEAQKEKCDILVFSELSLIGYPAEDLVLRKDLRKEADLYLESLIELTKDQKAAMIVGSIAVQDGKLYNAAYFISNGKIDAIIHKSILPNYGVFDEKRVFARGEVAKPTVFRNKKIQLIICEEMWHKDYVNKIEPVDYLISINASPFETEKFAARLKLAKYAVEKTGAPLLYVNEIGGQDNLVFDGGSFALNKNGEICHFAKFWQEEISIIDFTKTVDYQLPTKQENIFNALVLGTKDYIQKNGFSKVLLGISGGVDSALVAAIACKALGSNNVLGVMLPSEFTSEESFVDAKKLMQNLGMEYLEIPISDMFEVGKNSLKKVLKNYKEDIAEENMQARIRGVLLMAISNKNNALLLSTGNKSELAVGYSTIYGDMCGAFNPLKDLYKTGVYELCNWLNASKEIIPINIITKAPTAELKPNQKDQDTLPEYEILDRILYLFIEEKQGLEEIVAAGFEKNLVKRIIKMVKLSEYKRFQSPLGIKISKQFFGLDRRIPITNGFFS